MNLGLPIGRDNVRLTMSTQDKSTGHVLQNPADLLAQARNVAPWIDAEVYSLARVVASENPTGTDAERVCIADSDALRASQAGQSILRFVTGTVGRYGGQGTGGRLQATSRDPALSHAVIAQAALLDHRGIAKGATRYFDPRAQISLHLKGRAAHLPTLHPLTVLEKWTYNKPCVSKKFNSAGKYVCELGKRVGRGEEWVGPIAGVRPTVLMLFRAATEEQDDRYAQAKQIIETMLTDGASSADALYAASAGVAPIALAGLLLWAGMS